MAKSSFLAEGLIRTLYLPTTLQFLNDLLKRQIRLAASLFKGEKILCIFHETQADRLIDQVRHRSLCLCGLEAEGPMESRVEINRGALLGVFHGAMVALRRHSVNFEATVGVRSNT
jgi:hypothetical protein